jgi:hypothetical protein
MKQVTITFSEFRTESDYDFVWVAQCDTSSCNTGEILAELSGSYSSTKTFTAASGFMLVSFSSDDYDRFPGFTASWTSSWVSHNLQWK